MPDLVAHIARVQMTGICERELISLGILNMSLLSFAQAADLEKAGLGAVAAKALLSVSYELKCL
jgi:hypothetical protein